MARKVFISVLGYTNYGECIYTKEDYKSCSVRFIQEATLEYLLQQSEWTAADAAYIMLTDEAEKANWYDNGHNNRDTGETITCEGLQTRLDKMQLPFDVQTISHLPHGNNEDEIWKIFEETFSRLQDGDELYFDLTHGFRYLPMLVMVLINYSKFLKNASVKSITYGNYESRNGRNEAPIIDLLPLSALQDWTYAAGQFLDSGNVQRLIELSKTKIRPVMISSKGKDAEAVMLSGFTKYLGDVVEDMQTCRGTNIMNLVNLVQLRKYITEIQSTFIKPLNPVFEKVKLRFECFNEMGHASNLFEAAKWCLDNGLYQQAITILQEGILTYLCMYMYKDKDFRDRDLRTLVGAAINLYGQKKVITFPSYYTEEQVMLVKSVVDAISQDESLQHYARVFVSCTEFRNDLNHSGMRSNPKTASIIKNGICKVINRVFNEEYELKACDNFKEKLFINLSNHPCEFWDEKQKMAASEYGEIKDLPFPMVDANDDTMYIETLADEYFQKIKDFACDYDVTVHLMGELTLTFSLLKRLQEYGIRCVASTSKRIVKEEIPGRKEEVIFEFERFREYC